jgi:high-affinity iron transporter
MLATLVIGLREGLEASLIVGIIAAFLRRTGKPLRPMWIGVGIAVALSIAVGVLLQEISASLPQAQQEGMESIIGLVAVAVVTGMIGWMNTHARNMRSELEQHAALALKDGTAWALVGMAFLAVLKEGFETSVFLLAAFQSSTSTVAASLGAVIGVAIAVAIGIGIFRGGVHLDLGRFFRITGIFLVFVAAGLVLSSLRTAHEAGWVVIGQQSTVNLSWFAPAGSVQAALLTGVLGIPADPRLIEVIGWFAYLIPTMLFLLWPAKHRPAGRALALVRVSLAATLVIVAGALAIAIPLPSYSPASTVPIAGTDGSNGTATLTAHTSSFTFATDPRSDWSIGAIRPGDTVSTTHEGVSAQLLRSKLTETPNGELPRHEPTTISLAQLVELSGGRLPIGFSASQNPGPFAASWKETGETSLWIYNGGLLDAQRTATTIVTLTGGGLTSPRTLTPDAAQTDAWRMSPAARSTVVNAIARTSTATAELLLWKLWIPLALAIAALVLVCYALRSAFRKGRTSPSQSIRTKRKSKENYA